MNIEMIKAHVRTIPDFPKPGILFRDITTVYKDAACLQELTRSLTDYYKDKGANPASCLLAPYSKATRKSMASTPSRFTRML